MFKTLSEWNIVTDKKHYILFAIRIIMAGQIITKLSDFLEKEYDSIALGISPSGHIHPGFLLVLSVVLIYLKKHPKCKLKITITDVSRPQRVEVHDYFPLRLRKSPLTGKPLIKTTSKETLHFTGMLCNAFDTEVYRLLMDIDLTALLNTKTKLASLMHIEKYYLEECAKISEVLKDREHEAELVEALRAKFARAPSENSVCKRVHQFMFSEEIGKSAFRKYFKRIILNPQISTEIVRQLEPSYTTGRDYHHVPLYGVCPSCRRTVGARLRV